MPPVAPMLAKSATALPDGDGWLYEPKWDGFRCIVFRDGDEVDAREPQRTAADPLLPRAARPAARAACPTRRCSTASSWCATRRGPRLRRPAAAHPPGRVPGQAAGGGDPRPSWPSTSSPSDDRDLRDTSPSTSAAGLLAALLAASSRRSTSRPRPRDVVEARDWFARFEGAGLDGVVAKPPAEPYRPGERAMVKVKHDRTADCVVAGFRWHKDGDGHRVAAARAVRRRRRAAPRRGVRQLHRPSTGASWSTCSSRSEPARSTTTRGRSGPT